MHGSDRCIDLHRIGLLGLSELVVGKWYYGMPPRTKTQSTTLQSPDAAYRLGPGQVCDLAQLPGGARWGRMTVDRVP
jgi:hypothetical protein